VEFPPKSGRNANSMDSEARRRSKMPDAFAGTPEGALRCTTEAAAWPTRSSPSKGGAEGLMVGCVRRCGLCASFL
jgi:hypothetical protein